MNLKSYAKFLIGLAFLFVGIVLGVNAVSAQSILTTIPIGPEAGSGFGPFEVEVNPTTNRIYVADGSSGTISVIDGETDQVIDTVRVRDRLTGVGVNPTTNRIYALNNPSNFEDSTVKVINGKTNRVIDNIKMGDFIGGIGINPKTNLIYVTVGISPNFGSVRQQISGQQISGLQISK